MSKKQGCKTLQKEIEILEGKENSKVPKNTSEEKETFCNSFLRTSYTERSIVINDGT